MPAWLSFLLPWILKLIAQYGLPLIEQKWPSLKPIIDEILAILGGVVPGPSSALQSAADHYNALKSQPAPKPA